MCVKVLSELPELTGADAEAALPGGGWWWWADSDSQGGPTHRRVGPMQLVSVLSISRSMRSCSAAVSTLAILHVALELRR